MRNKKKIIHRKDGRRLQLVQNLDTAHILHSFLNISQKILIK